MLLPEAIALEWLDGNAKTALDTPALRSLVKFYLAWVTSVVIILNFYNVC